MYNQILDSLKKMWSEFNMLMVSLDILKARKMWMVNNKSEKWSESVHFVNACCCFLNVGLSLWFRKIISERWQFTRYRNSWKLEEYSRSWSNRVYLQEFPYRKMARLHWVFHRSIKTIKVFWMVHYF